MKKPGKFFIKLILWGIGLSFFLFFAGIIGILIVYDYYSENLPAISSLKDYKPPVISTVYSDNNQVIAEFFKERRIVIPLSQMPPLLIKAFVAAEDSRFYEHKGIDLVSIIRAAIKNVEAGSIVQGGSTITQQVTKSFLLTPEKKFSRKIKEAILAYRIDNTFSKDEILFLYLNQIYLGHGAYGVEAAAHNYFDKTAKELSLAECAILAGLPQAPSRYSPYTNMKAAKKRQKYVLEQMKKNGFITQDMLQKALDEKLTIHARKNLYIEKAPYYTEYIRKYILDKYGEDALYKGGLKIRTAVNIKMQMVARKAIDKGLREHDKRHFGYRGPIKKILPDEIKARLEQLKKAARNKSPVKGDIVKAVVIKTDVKAKKVIVNTGNTKGFISFNSMKWATKRTEDRKNPLKLRNILHTGDLIWVGTGEKDKKNGMLKFYLEQPPKAQSALICIETETGQVKAMVGGRDFKNSQFNRAIQSRRQPGSAFKPIIYAAALDKGYTPATEIIDNVFVYKSRNMVWKPKNYDKKIKGHILLRQALAHSRNLSTINLLDHIGVDYAIDYARKLGIKSHLSRNLSIALGSSGVSLFELVSAYTVFANYGYKIEPVFINSIVDRNGKEIEGLEIKRKKVIDESTAYLITSLLESVIQQGTGRRVRAIGRPAAGKTGTTNDLHDAWFVGYTPDYVTGVWVGYDQEKSLGRRETGSRAASPIWLYFMKKIHEGKPLKTFKVPKNIVFAKIDAKTGLLPSPDTKETIFECFRAGTVPTKHSKSKSSIEGEDQFFKNDI